METNIFYSTIQWPKYYRRNWVHYMDQDSRDTRILDSKIMSNTIRIQILLNGLAYGFPCLVLPINIGLSLFDLPSLLVLLRVFTIYENISVNNAIKFYFKQLKSEGIWGLFKDLSIHIYIYNRFFLQYWNKKWASSVLNYSAIVFMLWWQWVNYIVVILLSARMSWSFDIKQIRG